MTHPHFVGDLRLHANASTPWRYTGRLHLPSGRYCSIRASVAEDDMGRFFKIEGGLQPGMSAAELEAALTQIEAERARDAQRELDITDELPF
mgnify:FL=1|nr:hypothetical protein [uncultured Acidocella sp.]